MTQLACLTVEQELMWHWQIPLYYSCHESLLIDSAAECYRPLCCLIYEMGMECQFFKGNLYGCILSLLLVTVFHAKKNSLEWHINRVLSKRTCHSNYLGADL